MPPHLGCCDACTTLPTARHARTRRPSAPIGFRGQLPRRILNRWPQPAPGKMFPYLACRELSTAVPPAWHPRSSRPPKEARGRVQPPFLHTQARGTIWAPPNSHRAQYERAGFSLRPTGMKFARQHGHSRLRWFFPLDRSKLSNSVNCLRISPQLTPNSPAAEHPPG